MCGIAGILGPGAETSRVETMVAGLRHRGPDGSGVWTSPGGDACLGHRRLAILDLSPAGAQPMTRGDLTLVYNGEIYNVAELRRELEAEGVELRSTSDTEVLLELYARHRAACVPRLVGMFAFAVWDERRRELFAARDRLGIKPFAYRPTSGGFAFASEIDVLAGLAPTSIDTTALRDFFTYKYVPSPKTIHRGILKLPAAHTLTWSASDGIRLEEYWRPVSDDRIADLADATDELDELLHRVVREHTLSDVPVGVFLSGGVDSSTVAAHLDRPHTFNLGFDVRSHDETGEARAIADHLGCRHETLRARSGDLGEALDLIAQIYDEPFGDHGAFPVYQIARMARTHATQPVTVALSGEGGDELFAGYQWHDKQQRLRGGPGQRLLRAIAPRSSAAFRSAERRLLRGVDRYATFLGPFTVRQKQALLGPELMRDGGYDDLWAFRAHWHDDLHPTKRLQWLDVHGYLRDDMMPKLDRATMAVSLEARPPLVDHRVVEFALALHPDLLFHEGRGKRVLRAALARHVPPELLTPRKIGFSAPIRRWSNRQPALLRAAQRRLHERGILHRPFVRLATNEQTWCVLVLDRWLTEHAP